MASQPELDGSGSTDSLFASTERLKRYLERGTTDLWLALTREEYAHALVARGVPGDREAAEDSRAQALAAYRELGMAHHEVGAGPAASRR